MERIEILESYPWYIPAHIATWRKQQGKEVSKITELIVMNHPEAVAEQEEVDIDFLMSLIEEERPKPHSPVKILDAISSLEMMQQTKPSKQSASRGLIDKFLEVKDLRIVPPRDEDENEVPDLVWEVADTEQQHSIEDDLASEELARIYLNQKLYKEASDIYNRLFLLYSEKSVYFASQIENIDKILEESGEK